VIHRVPQSVTSVYVDVPFKMHLTDTMQFLPHKII